MTDERGAGGSPPYVCYDRARFETMSDITISPARPEDLEVIKALLLESGLPIAGVDENWKTFLIARDGDAPVGCGGAEAYQVVALIRSIAVKPDYRSHGIGRRLVRQLLDRLASRGLREFYLLTTTAEEYFKKRGFKTIDRDEVHPQLLSSREFQDACPSTATCMRLVMLA
jgi:N-acetylglutamate synthase-like GNAT family acetyltransferase